MRRCKDCKYWAPRKGCVHPAELARTHAVAIVMDRYSIYRHTNCDGFIEKKKEEAHEPDRRRQQ